MSFPSSTVRTPLVSPSSKSSSSASISDYGTDTESHPPQNPLPHTKSFNSTLSDPPPPSIPHPQSHVIRNATWQTVFFLITTDILGPTSAPYALSQLGYVPGGVLFVIMGFAAGYTGFLLWKLYLLLDGEGGEILTYSDLALKIYGKGLRQGVNLLQSLQLLFNVAVIILSNAQGLAQISGGRLCFPLLALIWTGGGMMLGQIKQLQNLKHLSNAAIWMNFSVIFITMALVATSPPNYDSAFSQNQIAKGNGDVHTGWFISVPFTAQMVGVMQIVYSYGGALMFVEFMAEMKKPRDFWKSMLSAQTIIGICYLIFGIFVYKYQGQYTINPANQGISTYSWQTAANILNLLSALIAAGLYGNVGMKIIYQSVMIDMFDGPPLQSKSGKTIWIFLCLLYWAISFLVASSIPQFSNISGLVAALCVLQFTYTFPPMFMLGYQLQVDADHQNTNNYSFWGKYLRAFFISWRSNSFNLILFVASCFTAGLGVYSSISQIITGFHTDGAAASFGCKAPV